MRIPQWVRCLFGFHGPIWERERLFGYADTAEQFCKSCGTVTWRHPSQFRF